MSVKRNKIIVTAAITGAIHTPTMSPYLPMGVQGIANAAIESAEAGASIVHIHNRCDDGRPTSDIDTFGEILSKIKKNSNVVTGISTGGGAGMSREERLSTISIFKPEMASFNSGSINFVLSGLATTIVDPKFDWEIPFLQGTYDNVFRNSFGDLEYTLNLMEENGTLPEFEIFDLGQINNIAYFYKKGLIKRPPYFQFVPGVMGGIPLTKENVATFIQILKSTFGEDVRFSMVSSGRRAYRFETLSVISGGNVRVGLEDSLYINAKGDLAKSNAEQVLKMKKILEMLDYEIASPDEAREMLSLKGRENTNF